MTDRVIQTKWPKRLLFVAGVLFLASCSNMCGSTPQAAHTSPPAKAPIADASCTAESQSHSVNSNTPTMFTITNQTSVTLTLFWLNFQGRRIKYFDLTPGMTRSQGTFVTHPWVVADSKGGCIRLFLVTDPIRITIG